MARIGGQVGKAAPAVRGVLPVTVAALAVGGPLVFQGEVLGIELILVIVRKPIFIMQGVSVHRQCGVPLAEVFTVVLVGIWEAHVLRKG
jgi:hypothetical protein